MKVLVPCARFFVPDIRRHRPEYPAINPVNDMLPNINNALDNYAIEP